MNILRLFTLTGLTACFFFANIGFSGHAAFCLYAQTGPVEICNNGIDDDGDGLIDCFDPDCTCTGQCDDFYYTTCNADCAFLPPCGQISLGVQWESNVETGTYSSLVAGDLDGDGIPEIVAYRCESNRLFILDGQTGALKVTITTPTILPGGTTPAIADLSNDGFGEIVIVGNDRRLRCYSHTGQLKWFSFLLVGYDQRYRCSSPSIADLNQNGLPEIVIGNQVFNGQNGQLIASGGAAGSAGEHPLRNLTGFSFNASVPMDVLPDGFCNHCQGLEIVAGNRVYSVNLATGQVQTVVSAPPGYSDGYTSIADFDGDGDLDAIVQGQKNGQNTIYVWDLQTPTILREFALYNNWPEGASRANVADLDGDGRPDISFVSYPELYALNNDFNVMWTRDVFDVSAVTCSSVFDFCGDGSSEVVYRGQEYLQIFDGATGAVIWQDECFSATHIEYPLVLDVDGDGQTEIVIQCGYTDVGQGRVIAYEAVGAPGISSRRVWNQHGYHNTNINDDLSVPRVMQVPHIIGDKVKMNAFLNQYFNPSFPASDASAEALDLVCIGDSLELRFRVCNEGAIILPPQTPIAAYAGNPRLGPALGVGVRDLGEGLLPDSCIVLTLRIPRVANDSIYLALNDDLSQPTPYDIASVFPVTTIGECDFVNNFTAFFFPYNPDIPDLGPDQIVCQSAVLTLTVGEQDMIAYFWSTGDTGSSVSGVKAPAEIWVSATDICGIVYSDTLRLALDSNTVADLGPDVFVCSGESVTLNLPGFDTYQWSANYVPPGCETCPQVTFVPQTDGVLTVYVELNNGCYSADTIQVNVYPVYDYSMDTSLCLGYTLDWFGTPLLPGETRVFDLQTFQGCDSILTVRVMAKDTFATAETRIICHNETSLIFGQPVNVSGTYLQTFTALNGCDSTHTIVLTVRPPLTLALDADPSCGDENTGALTAEVFGVSPPFEYQWQPPAANQPQLNGLPPGFYALTVRDAVGCTQQASVTVTAYPPIVFDLEAVNARCFGEKNGAIRLQSANPDLLFNLNGSVFRPTTQFDSLFAGSYIVGAQDEYGCEVIQPVVISEPPQVLAILPDDVTLRFGETFAITGQISGSSALIYNWMPPTFLSCADCLAPLARPTETMTYTLVVSDAFNCTAEDQITLTVNPKADYYVPNIVSPNANTDLNALLTPNFGPAVDRVRLFQVYDRWGGLMHEARMSAPGDVSLSWDPRRAAPGVYVWLLELELFYGGLLRLTGDVTVVR